MFLKIIQQINGSEHMKVYDCIKYKIYPGDPKLTDTPKESVSLLIDVGEQTERAIMLEKATSEIIVTNNDGKTVDRHRWSEQLGN